MKEKNKIKNMHFFVLIFFLILLFFLSVFKINFFQDDYFFLKISRVNSIIDFFKFYSPIREYSYKPLATETFYFILHVFKENIFIGKSIVFITFFIGLIFFYKIVLNLTKKELLARLTILIYGLSFIHVFQLYWFATFQEVAVFCFLSISFYSFLKNKSILSGLFFIFALFCKETAILYILFLGLFVFVFDKNKLKKIAVHVVISFIFLLLYRYSLTFVTSLDNYKIVWNPKLLINNSVWYFLWGIGFPNFLPDYFRSIFSKPIVTFWEILKIPYTKVYLSLLFIYLIFLFIGFLSYVIARIRQLAETKQSHMRLPRPFGWRSHPFGWRSHPFGTRNDIMLILYLLANFFIFLGPILFFRHKWMIRLTMPFIFIAVIEALIIYYLLVNKNKWFNGLGVFLVIIYCIWNFFGVKVHEVSSTYLLENSIYLKTQAYFKKNKDEILKYDVIYLKDITHNLPAGWNGSEKLINSFANENFIDHFLPEKKIKVIFDFQNKKKPKNSYVINSNKLLP